MKISVEFEFVISNLLDEHSAIILSSMMLSGWYVTKNMINLIVLLFIFLIMLILSCTNYDSGIQQSDTRSTHIQTPNQYVDNFPSNVQTTVSIHPTHIQTSDQHTNIQGIAPFSHLSGQHTNIQPTVPDVDNVMKSILDDSVIITSHEIPCLTSPDNAPTKKSKSSRRESKGEKECRKFFESHYGVSFPKQRPDFLRNPKTGRCLELDGYNGDLGIAFEYNGKQHYERVEYFQKNNNQFLDQKYRDNLKRQLCMKNSVILVIVPYNVGDIHQFLSKKVEIVERKIIERMKAKKCVT